ncbi:hypothetical protein PLESTF_001012100 [Pleodorina starrii]|nr:hypothetical protein PLESTF_001012100 [Pleodorina starrii]
MDAACESACSGDSRQQSGSSSSSDEYDEERPSQQPSPDTVALAVGVCQAQPAPGTGPGTGTALSTRAAPASAAPSTTQKHDAAAHADDTAAPNDEQEGSMECEDNAYSILFYWWATLHAGILRSFHDPHRKQRLFLHHLWPPLFAVLSISLQALLPILVITSISSQSVPSLRALAGLQLPQPPQQLLLSQPPPPPPLQQLLPQQLLPQQLLPQPPQQPQQPTAAGRSDTETASTQPPQAAAGPLLVSVGAAEEQGLLLTARVAVVAYIALAIILDDGVCLYQLARHLLRLRGSELARGMGRAFPPFVAAMALLCVAYAGVMVMIFYTVLVTVGQAQALLDVILSGTGTTFVLNIDNQFRAVRPAPLERMKAYFAAKAVGGGRSSGAAVARVNVFQVCDRFAEAGLNVCAIDPFHGKPWTLEKFPPKPEDDFMGWLGRVGSWGALEPSIKAAAELLKSEGATKLGCIGFCWGVSIALHAGQDASTFSACGGAHPALFGKDAELADKVACPVILLPAKGDAPTDVFQKKLESRPYGSKCVYQRFDDQTHGFVAARGDWSKPEVAEAAGKAIHLMTHFLKEAMA